MVMERNPNYHEELYPTEGEPGDGPAGLLRDAGRRLPFIDKIVFSLDKESIPRWNKFLQGYYDRSGVQPEGFDQAIRFTGEGDAEISDAMMQKGIRLLTSVAASTYYLGFNMLDPVVGGYTERARKLRRAITIAVDFEEQISIFENGRGIAAQGPLAPGIFGYREGRAGINPYVYDWVDDKPRRKPIEFARTLLAEAQAALDQLRNTRHGPGTQSSARLDAQTIQETGHSTSGARHGLQPFPGKDAQRRCANIRLGLERGLSGPGEFLVPALWAE
jgi:ABC-type oligopeptide transport system substrate-binding subunit